jgi:predicted amidophosphoribosyltransferase
MNVRDKFEKYFLSWFIRPEFDYDLLVKEKNPDEYVPLSGKFDWGLALDYYKKGNNEERTLLGECLYRFKYNHDEKCGQVLSELLKRFLENNQPEYDIDLTTIVPVTLTGRLFRIMEYILSQPGFPVPGDLIPGLLIRKKIIGQAKEIRGAWRKKEVVRGLYKINENFEVSEKNILIFDDIYDSGATLNECTRILKNAGANNVRAITLVLTRRGQN